MESNSFGGNDPLLLNDIPSSNVLSSNPADTEGSSTEMRQRRTQVYSRERRGVSAARSGLLDLVETSQLSNRLIGRGGELDVLEEEQEN